MTDSPTPLRIGIVGCGVVTQSYLLPHLVANEPHRAVELVGLCDRNEEALAQARAKCPEVRGYGSLENLLDDAEVEAVVVATPIPLHYAHVRQSLESGRPVYVQKTLAATYVEASELASLADDNSLVLIASPGQMLAHSLRAVRDAVSIGQIGEVYWGLGVTSDPGHERVASRETVAADPTWYYKPGGGPVADMGVYALHSLTGMLGSVASVAAMSKIRLPRREWAGAEIQVEMDDSTSLLLEFTSGPIGIIGANYCYPGASLHWGFTGLYGSEGSIELAQSSPGSSLPFGVRGTGSGETFRLPDTKGELAPHVVGQHAELPGQHLWADLAHFVDCVRDKTTPIATSAHAVHVIEIIEKGYTASRTGHTQSIESRFEQV